MTPGLIISLGSINADFWARVPCEPGSSDLIVSGEFHRFSGGKALNRAWWAKMLGHDARLFGRTGDDDLAGQALAAARQAGLDIGGVSVAEVAATAVAMIAVPESTKKQIVLCPNANREWDEAATQSLVEAIEEAPEGSLVTADLEIPAEVVERALRAARERNLVTLVDPSPAAAATDELLELATALCPNHSEAAEILGFAVDSAADGAKAVACLRDKGVTCPAVKLADGGAVVAEGEQALVVPAWEVEAVDTTGAGDAFAGGFAAGLARGWSPLRAAALGNATASLTTTGPGSQPGNLEAEELFDVADQLCERARPG